uniref:Uncharacterized protein n=1 Tax=Panagrolaimus superbus TaxID=310955 RepID=A0A914XWD2_9BILA
MVGIISRQEHLNPQFQPVHHKEERKNLWANLGVSNEMAKNVEKYMETVPKFDYIIKGHQCRDGDEIPQDYTKAAAWYAKAAHIGVPEGMYNLALLYEYGRGVPRDYDESFRWLIKASEGKADLMHGSGIPEAQHTLGLKYTEGVGVEKNFKLAIEWYEKAVKNGSAGSANNLGTFYEKGIGIEKNFEKAFYFYKLASQWGMKWLKIASENGNLKAEKYLEKHSKMTADEVEDATIENIMFPKQPSKANPLDQELYGKAVREAASKGSKMAQNLIEIWNHMNFAMEAFKKKNYALLVQELSHAIFIDHQIVEVPEMFIPCIKEMIEE